MVDPTSDLNEDVDEADAPACEQCGSKLAADPDHRVVTWVEGTEVRTVHFCGDDCRGEWLDGRS